VNTEGTVPASHRPARRAPAAVACLLLAAAAAAAQDDPVRALERRVEELEARIASGGGSAEGAALQDSLPKGVPTKKGSLLRFYGFLRLDAIYDDSSPNNTQTIGWVRPEDPTAAGGADHNDPDFTMHPRLTRFGFDLDGGALKGLGAPKVAGKMEVDFYNSGLTGQSESRAALRMRHAYLTLDWGGKVLLAGQTNDLISPLWPVVNPDLVNWGAGNLGDRRPQVRYTAPVALGGDAKLTVAGMVGLTGAVDNQNLDTDGIRDGEASGYPTVQGRIGLVTPLGKKSLDVGVWGSFARENVEVPIGGEDMFQSRALGADATIPLAASLYLKGEAWFGSNLDDLRGGIFQGVNGVTGNEIDSHGGWAEIGWNASPATLIAAGYSVDDPDNGDVGVGGRSRNRVVFFAIHWTYDPVEFGVDVLRWHTEFVGQRGGLDNRVQAYIAYHF
jgi:hypothetical protein